MTNEERAVFAERFYACHFKRVQHLNKMKVFGPAEIILVEAATAGHVNTVKLLVAKRVRRAGWTWIIDEAIKGAQKNGHKEVVAYLKEVDEKGKY